MKVGIDLGTTNSAVSYIDENGQPQIVQNREGERTTPSVIFFEGTTPIVGSTAKGCSVSDPFNTVQFVKRHMGDKNYEYRNENGDFFTAEELSAMILKRIKEDAEESLNATIDQAVITVPAYFNDAQRKATMDAGKIAGINVLKVINEPTAAALAYGFGKQSQVENILIYDLGGGTFDVTILSINKDEVRVKATDGARNLGGFDFDNKIINYIIEKFENKHRIDLFEDDIAMQELREKAESCKRMLMVREKAPISVSSQGRSLRIDMMREKFNELIAHELNRTMMIMKSTLADSGLTWSDIHKILLVGGSTRIKAVTDAIINLTGITPSSELNPDEVVAIGAAIQAELIQEDEHEKVGGEENIPKRKVYDVNSHSLGILSLNEEERTYNSIILPRNSEIPAQESELYRTLKENQEFVHLRITEGDDEDPEYVRIVGETNITLPKNCPKGFLVKVTISYDENSIVHVLASDGETNEPLGDVTIQRASNLSDDSIQEKLNKLSEIEIE